jgi:hypothetical protein
MQLHSDQIDELQYLFESTSNIEVVNKKIDKYYQNARCNYLNKNHCSFYIRDIPSLKS